MKKVILLLIAAALVFGTVFATSTLEQILESGKITILCGSGQNPLLKFIDQDGNPSGLIPDLLYLAAEKLGVDIEWDFSNVGLDQMPYYLSIGKADMVAVPFSIKFPMMGSLRFSEPYIVMRVTALVRVDSELTHVNDLANPSVRVAVPSPTLYEKEAFEDVFGREVLVTGSLNVMIENLQNGLVDAFVRDDIMLEIICKARSLPDSEFRILEGSIMPDPWGFVFAKGPETDELVEWFNWFLRWTKFSGKYEELYEKYFERPWLPEMFLDY
ncbi:ABC transporter substrate-binding protein [Mesotoga sp. B105.6.4]|uniref:substrate-binding periplasmic protein n=1 Tax=Mesotoga sp. B105.6.4 TaxID=1582224 RepID=UPI000CCBFFB4|nr:transporter substrate-binding domain-containing protein [Mesotoga sp. B105.6.4]PNS35969.1 hypothetical protein RJ60_13270 [Mesotoga sp. B105.6.4]